MSAVLQTIAEEHFLNSLDRAADKFSKLMEHWENRLTIQGKPLIEQYQQGRLTLMCDLAVHLSNQFISGDTVASENPSIDGICLASLVFRANVIHDAYVHDWDQKPVFIENVELVQSPKGIIPSLVRLYGIHNESSDLWGGLLYQSTIDGRYQAIPSFSEWESSVVVVTSEPSKNDFVNSEIESAPEIMESIPNDESKIVRSQFRHFDFKNIISSLGISIDAECVRATFGKQIGFRVEIRDVLLGPFNL